MSRIEEIQGHRWAVEICRTSLEQMRGGRASLLEMLGRGLIEKPPGFKLAVQRAIDLVEAQPDVETGQVHESCEG